MNKRLGLLIIPMLILTGCSGVGDTPPSAANSTGDKPQVAQPTIPAPSILLDNSASLLVEAQKELQAQITLNASYQGLLNAAESRQNQAIAEAANLRAGLADYNFQVANARTYKADLEAQQAITANLTGQLDKLAATGNQTATLIQALSANVTRLSANNTALTSQNNNLATLLTLANERIVYLEALTANTTGGE